MDPETLDTVVEGLKVGGVILAGAVAVTAGVLGGAATIIKYSERKHLVGEMMPAYENGHLNTKPTVFNIYKMTDPKTADEYRVSKE